MHVIDILVIATGNAFYLILSYNTLYRHIINFLCIFPKLTGSPA